MTRGSYALGLGANLLVLIGASIGAYTGLLGRMGFGWVGTYDYIFHGLIFGPLAMFLDGVLVFRPLAPRLGWFPPLAAVLVLVAAGTEELLQQLSPRRTTQLQDFVSDTVGVILFVTVARVLSERASRASRQRPA